MAYAPQGGPSARVRGIAPARLERSRSPLRARRAAKAKATGGGGPWTGEGTVGEAASEPWEEFPDTEAGTELAEPGEPAQEAGRWPGEERVTALSADMWHPRSKRDGPAGWRFRIKNLHPDVTVEEARA